MREFISFRGPVLDHVELNTFPHLSLFTHFALNTSVHVTSHMHVHHTLTQNNRGTHAQKEAHTFIDSISNARRQGRDHQDHEEEAQEGRQAGRQATDQDREGDIADGSTRLKFMCCICSETDALGVYAQGSNNLCLVASAQLLLTAHNTADHVHTGGLVFQLLLTT